MKPREIVPGISALAISVLLLMVNTAASQQPHAGHWEGTFMGDFKTVIQLKANDDQSLSGSIQMFSGGSIIQDDELSKVTISDNHFTFYIKEKQSEFNGSFNEDLSELSGHFIFPDQTQHPITLFKSQVENQNEQSSRETYLESKNRHFQDGELIADVNFLMRNLIENHPQLYGYTAEDSFKKEWERALNKIDHDLTLEAYFKVLAPLVEKVNCSHTGIRLPVLYQQAAYEHGNYLPLELVCKDYKAYYLSSYARINEDVLPGTEIHSINDVPMSDIIGQMLSLIPSEGGCLTAKYNEINRNFHTYFYLLDNSEAFDVEFLSPNVSVKSKFPSFSYQEVTLHSAKEEPGLPVEFISDKNNDVGMIRVSSFNIRDMDGYMKLLEQLFLEFQVNKPSHLIIDLRNNTGGHPIFAAQLLSYLTSSEFTYFKRNPEVEDFEPLYNPMQPNPLHYEGNLFVLVNGGCLSTTGHLLSLLKYHTNAKFVGEEPGSSYCCNDYSMQVTLPNSGLEVNIPRATFETAVSGFNKGEPFPVDYYVENSVTDIIKGTDCYLSQVYKLIKGERLGKSTAPPG